MDTCPPKISVTGKESVLSTPEKYRLANEINARIINDVLLLCFHLNHRAGYYFRPEE